ncbi:MAG: MFS transporter [Dehalococcoidia bacterium]|nr:MFS transporter [Dehalococcoidia bacterium]
MIRRLFAGIGTNVLLLGIVSLLTDLSSEMMVSILPMYITWLGGTAFVVGLTGGLGDSISSLLKVFSGYLSDRTGRRKPFVFFGYGASAVAKLAMALAGTWGQILGFRAVERTGKGLRDAPRDAIIADSAASEARGKAFGIHRTMDTVGAIGGSLMALLLFWVFGLRYETILLASAIVAFASLIPCFWIKDVRREPQKRGPNLDPRALPRELRFFVFVATIFALGNFTSWFFVLRARDFFLTQTDSQEKAAAIAIGLYCMFNVVYAAFSIPVGILSDRIGRRRILLAGYTLLSITFFAFAFFQSVPTFVIFFILYGLIYAFVEGAERAFVCDMAPEHVRGTALGTLHTAIGLVALPAGIIAGVLWERIDSWAAFVYGGSMGLIAAALLMLGMRTLPTSGAPACTTTGNEPANRTQPG